jgi:hypothetical protein
MVDAQINRRDTKFRNLGIRLGYQILTFGLMKMYIHVTVRLILAIMTSIICALGTIINVEQDKNNYFLQVLYSQITKIYKSGYPSGLPKILAKIYPWFMTHRWLIYR